MAWNSQRLPQKVKYFFGGTLDLFQLLTTIYTFADCVLKFLLDSSWGTCTFDLDRESLPDRLFLFGSPLKCMETINPDSGAKRFVH